MSAGGVFVIRPPPRLRGSFVCVSAAATMPDHNMCLQPGHRRLSPTPFLMSGSIHAAVGGCAEAAIVVLVLLSRDVETFDYIVTLV